MADPGRLEAEAVESRLARLDQLLGQLEQTPGRTAATALEAVELLTEVYAEALARIGDAVPLRAAADDELVSHLLVLHGLHPDPPEVRLARAVADAGQAVARQGATVELMESTEEGVHIGVFRSGCGCGPATDLHASVRDHVAAAVPEIGPVEVVDRPRPRLIPVDAILRRPDPAGAA
jgi:hypothetical protein